MRRLEHDLNRFTIELEADTAGITEILEQSKEEVYIVLLCFVVCLTLHVHVLASFLSSHLINVYTCMYSVLTVYIIHVHVYDFYEIMCNVM